MPLKFLVEDTSMLRRILPLPVSKKRPCTRTFVNMINSSCTRLACCRPFHSRLSFMTLRSPSFERMRVTPKFDAIGGPLFFNTPCFSTKCHSDADDNDASRSNITFRVTEKLQKAIEDGEVDVEGALKGVKFGDGKMALYFTCKVCEMRIGKQISRQAYDNGVIIARCDGCENLHLISDILGYFGETWDIEQLMKEEGDNIKVVGAEDDGNLLQIVFAEEDA